VTKVLRTYAAHGPPLELARFDLQPDGRIVATYASKALRAEHEIDGVYTALHGEVRVADGARFLDALELSLSVSSFWRLEDPA